MNIVINETEKEKINQTITIKANNDGSISIVGDDLTEKTAYKMLEALTFATAQISMKKRVLSVLTIMEILHDVHDTVGNGLDRALGDNE